MNNSLLILLKGPGHGSVYKLNAIFSALNYKTYSISCAELKSVDNAIQMLSVSTPKTVLVLHDCNKCSREVFNLIKSMLDAPHEDNPIVLCEYEKLSYDIPYDIKDRLKIITF